MIYVTHDQVEAMTLGDRIAVMDRGRLQQVGTPEEIYGRPRNVFVARFVGSPAMNLLPGPAVGRGGRTSSVGIRPETLRPAAELAGGLALEIVAEVVEPLGSDVFVHGRTDAGQDVVARLPGNARVAAGERVAPGRPRRARCTCSTPRPARGFIATRAPWRLGGGAGPAGRALHGCAVQRRGQAPMLHLRR